ncbi:type IV pilus biogenesis protein PilM [Thermosediminibacter litoriperuensis]|uniref:Type IV pilus assembly protein PilM n=1 Tax=Thermosediminibacter litoriperuensis TaxID=291989 RepID=A0A5S5APQ3_9FIRM|nr:pilus assembly protein PilM [Thermosediminibacter litoriperuensis]TYP53298.1 type IV pilus assembly protein PilM [Thermosediminibacter litoriperuensis]
MNWLRLRGQKGLLGVDLGTARIKVAVVKGDCLLAKGAVSAPAGGWDNITEMVAALAEAVQETGWRGRKAVGAVSGERVVVRYLRLPRMPEKDLRAGLQYEAERYLPVGTQDMVIDFAILDEEPAGQPGQMLVLLAAAPREQVIQYYHLFQEAGLELEALDLIPAALCRALGTTGGEEESIILDLGEQWSQVVLARGDRLLFSRAVRVGCRQLVGGTLSSGLNRAVDLIQEVRRSVDFYRSQGGGGFNPVRLWLTGGGAYLEGIKDHFSLELDLPAEIASPFSLGPEFAVAAGLALRER